MKQFKEYLIKNNYQSAKDLKIYFIPVRQDEMMRLYDSGELIEYVNYNDNFYG